MNLVTEILKSTLQKGAMLLAVLLLAEGSVAAPELMGMEMERLAQSVAQNSSLTEADLLLRMGLVFYREGTADSLQVALEFLEMARELYQDAGNTEMKTVTLLLMGRIYHDLGNKQEALAIYQTALHEARSIGDRDSEASALNNIGNIYDNNGERQQALDYYQQALSTAQAIGDRIAEATTLNNIGEVYNSLGEKQQALNYYQQALSIVRAIDDRDREAIILNNIGSTYSFLGEQQQALDYYQQALSIHRAIDNLPGEATTLNNIGVVYGELGEQQQALNYFQQALPIFQSIASPRGEAATLNNIGAIHDNLGEYQQALNYYEQALNIAQSTNNPVMEATTLNNIGGVYKNLGEQHQALDYFQQALFIVRATGNRSEEALVLNNIGAAYGNLGQRQRALDYYQQALSIHRTTGNRPGEAATLNNIGLVYSDLGEQQQALDYYQQALPINREVGDRSGEATTLANIGVAYHELGEIQRALDYYQRALPINREVGDRSGEATTLANIGAVYHELGEIQRALDYYQQALPLRQAIGDRAGEANSLNNIGGVYNDLGERQQALDYLLQALPLWQAVGDRDGEASTLYNLSVLYGDRGNLPEALEYINTAIEIVETLRADIGSDELRTSYFATVQDYYQFKIDLLMQLHDRDPEARHDIAAFNTSERARARTLLELLTEASVDIRQGVEPQLLSQERQLRQQLQSIEDRRVSQLQNTTDSDEIATLNRQFDAESEAILRQLDTLLVQIRANSPAYADLRYPDPLTLAQVQDRVLDRDTALLQYALGDDRSYVWVVTTDRIATYTLPGRDDIETAAREFYEVLKDPQMREDPTLRYTAPRARALSQQILASVPLPNTPRLLVVPDGALQYIPFAALPLPETSDYTPLLAEYEIVSLPSASSIDISRQQRQGRNLAPKLFAAIADPVFQPDDPRVSGSASATLPIELEVATRNLNLNRIARLPGTRREAEQILALVGGGDSARAFDFQADYNFAIGDTLSQYRYVHFATHGFVNSVNPQLSGIVLSLVEENGSSQKGFLRLHDIFNLNLPAELVVLSACQTGLGEDVRGEGMVGLTRGLMYAGAARTVVSLWAVNDDATAELMVRFYQGMWEENLSPSEALRAAQLSMWREEKWRNPYSWAAFSFQGEWRD